VIFPLLLEALIILTHYLSQHSRLLTRNIHLLELSRALVPRGDPEFLRPTFSFTIGVILLFSAAWIRHTCYQYLGHLFTFELSLRSDHHLITTGPYSVVRHPAYTGICLMLLGLYAVLFGEGSYVRVSGVLQAGHGIFVFSFSTFLWLALFVAFVKRTAVEDSILKDHFGKEWDEWEVRVRWKLLPGVY